MDNYFDPQPSPNLSESDPLRAWAAQLNDPDLVKLMATDPQGAAEKMARLGIPPPPPHIMSYADGLGANNSPTPEQRYALPGQTVGGAGPPADLPPPVIGTDGKMQGNFTSDQGTLGIRPGSLIDRGIKYFTPSPAAATPVSAKAPIAAPTPVSTGAFLNPPILEPEVNPSAIGGVPLPRARPAEAPPVATDLSARKKTDDVGDALGGFGKSLQGVKPSPPPAPNFVGTPSMRAPGHIAAPNLQALLSLVGQPTASPLGLTLGRLLATGKA